MTLTTRKMSDRHEEHVAEVLGGEKTRASGSTWHDKADGHQRHNKGYYRFAWDGKATLGKSLSVTREMWIKIGEQSGHLFTAIPLRFYRDTRLTEVDHDLIVTDLATFAQMQEDANRFHAIIEGTDHEYHSHKHGETVWDWTAEGQ